MKVSVNGYSAKHTVEFSKNSNISKPRMCLTYNGNTYYTPLTKDIDLPRMAYAGVGLSFNENESSYTAPFTYISNPFMYKYPTIIISSPNPTRNIVYYDDMSQSSYDTLENIDKIEITDNTTTWTLLGENHTTTITNVTIDSTKTYYIKCYFKNDVSPYTTSFEGNALQNNTYKFFIYYFEFFLEAGCEDIINNQSQSMITLEQLHLSFRYYNTDIFKKFSVRIGNHDYSGLNDFEYYNQGNDLVLGGYAVPSLNEYITFIFQSVQGFNVHVSYKLSDFLGWVGNTKEFFAIKVVRFS